MQIALAAPVRPGSISGNDVTAARWARRLTELGHAVTIVAIPPDGPHLGAEVIDELRQAEFLIALHARRCAAVVSWWHEERTGQPLVVGLAGTDLYIDLPGSREAFDSVTAAHHIVVLQPRAIDRLRSLGESLADKSTVVYQSVEPPLPARSVNAEVFSVVVLAHLRDVKDPLMSARAARLLPPASRVVVDHAGAAHDERWQQAADKEARLNSRYHWHGELDRPRALEMMAAGRVVACTSRFEGGANVVSEALAIGVPVIGTHIDGNIGLLGDDYPGLVPVGDHAALAALLQTLEADPPALAELQARVDARQSLTDPARERDAWAGVITEVLG